MSFGLSNEIITRIHSVFRKYPEIENATLYGSRAKGDYTPYSDIDLTFEGKNLSLNLIHQIAVDLDDLLLPYFFDLSIKEKITNPDLLDHIKRVGMEFYSLKSS